MKAQNLVKEFCVVTKFPRPFSSLNPFLTLFFNIIILENLNLMKMLHAYDESFVCDEEEEEEKRKEGFSSLSWTDTSIGFNALHLASSIGLSLVSIILMAWGMDVMAVTDGNQDITVFKRFSPLHLASLHGHLNIFKTILYYLNNADLVSKYVKGMLNSSSSLSASSFPLLPSSFISDAPISYRPVYDYYGNLISFPEDHVDGLRGSDSINSSISPSIGDISMFKSNNMFNQLLNKRNMDGETVLHVSTYHRRSLIVEWVLSLATAVNGSLIEQCQNQKNVKVKGDDEEEDDESDIDSDGDGDEKFAKNGKNVRNRLTKWEEKQKMVKVDVLDHQGMSPLMLGASRGFPEVLAHFASYNENLVINGYGREELKYLGLEDAIVDFGRREERKRDTVLHLACQSQLQRVFNYNYDLTEDHYACIYQIVTRMPDQVDLNAKNRDGDCSFDLLLEPVADLFELLYSISLLCLHYGIESLHMAYPNLRSFIDACKNGSHAIRCVSLSAIISQLSSTHEAQGMDHKMKVPTLEEVVKLGQEMFSIIESQCAILDEEDAKPCKLIETTKMPYTRKFKGVPRVAIEGEGEEGNSIPADSSCPFYSSSTNGTNTTTTPTSSQDGSSRDVCPMGFGSKKRVKVEEGGGISSQSHQNSLQSSSNSSTSVPSSSSMPSTTTTPSGHPDISKYPPGAVCPMGFGKKKPSSPPTTNDPLDSSSISSQKTNVQTSSLSETSVTGKRRFSLFSSSWMDSTDTLILVGATGLIATLAIFRLFSYATSTSSHQK
jgi:ankyrin repeat protein